MVVRQVQPPAIIHAFSAPLYTFQQVLLHYMATFLLQGQQRGERTLKLRLAHSGLTGSQASTAAGIPAGYTKVSAPTHGSGVYVINFLQAFKRTPVITANALSAAGKLFCVVAAASTTSCTINVFADTGTATNVTDLHVNVDGFDVADQV